MSAVMTPASPAVDLAAVKTRQQAAWSAGNYAVVGTTLQIVGETLCEALDLRSGSSVLDVAAGNGNASLAAARRWCEVTSTDYVPSLLTSGHARALAEVCAALALAGELSIIGALSAQQFTRAHERLARGRKPAQAGAQDAEEGGAEAGPAQP